MIYHPKEVYPYPTGDGFQRFSEEGMCPIKPYKNFADGTFIEGGTAAYVCRKADVDNPRFYIVTYLIAEVCWITKEYAIPLLNLIKIEAYGEEKHVRIIKYTIMVLFVLFIGCRIYIGYERTCHGLFTTPETKFGHMGAFSIMALADLICTIVVIDIISVVLAVFNGITELFKNDISGSLLNPLQNLKCSFILIMACDTVVFKYNIERSSETFITCKDYQNSFNYSKSYNINASFTN
ncbi:hypothetical protein PIROE2DRAFT_18883 [Piromyces sp. E2]|nr:hypothetical protein PIROE2DRAFT_18883 [Piromyces sp. E2]|eukprot:OUM56494.1 hypothetical protein PIROE2DRAFT_18883 [Piromyces sp. E2]